MKKYIGTKVVSAKPMTKGEAFERNLLKAGVEIDDTQSAEDGYMVEYEDGYTSWSPKEVFEKAYKLSENFLDRLIIEESDLNEKIIKLHHFIQSKEFIPLSENQQKLMKEQYEIMIKYHNILKLRIENERKN